MTSLILVGIFAYLIAHCFVSVFEMTVDTIFLCYCEDYEENNGSTKPYFMSPKLMKIMRKLNKNSKESFNQHSYQPKDLQQYPMDQIPQQVDAYNFNSQNAFPPHDPIVQPFIPRQTNDFAQPQHPGAFNTNVYPYQNEAYPMPNYNFQQPIGFHPLQFDHTAAAQPIYPPSNYSDSSSFYSPQSYPTTQQVHNSQPFYPPYNSHT